MPKRERCPLCRIVRGLALAVGGLLVLAGLAAGGVALWASRADLRPIAERAASAALGRQVTLDRLSVRWGDPLEVELTGLRIANASWGEAADMARIGRLSARVDPGSLLGGPLRYERLRIEDAAFALERNADGVGNWDFGVGPSAFAMVPRSRSEFPTLIDFAGSNGLITYRTHGAEVARIALDRVAVSSPGTLTPARLHAEGAYNEVAARLDAVTASFAALRDASDPFAARFTLAGQDTTISFDGSLAEPLDFEGARGEVSIEAQRLDDLLRVLGSTAEATLPLSVSGVLTREGDLWQLAAAKGQLMQSAFAGDLKLREGAAGEPDDIALDLDAGALDLDEIAAALGAGPTPLTEMKLRPTGLTALDLNAALRTSRLAAGGRTFHDVTMQGRLAGGDVTVKMLRFALAGGTFSGAGALAGREGSAGQLSLKARLTDAEAAEIAALLGAAGGEIGGRIDGTATLELHGTTVGGALRHSSGGVVLVLSEGDVARSLIERASVDLRSLFREQSGRVKARCLLAVMTLKDGVGTLGPLRLESDEAIVDGTGRVDLIDRRLDLVLESRRDSTHFFALDVPVRIAGPFAGLTAEPMLDEDEDSPQQAARTMEALPVALRDMARTSACVR